MFAEAELGATETLVSLPSVQADTKQDEAELYSL